MKLIALAWVCLSYTFSARTTRCIINRRVLKEADLLALFAYEGQELNVHLNVMTGHPLLVSLGMDLTHASATRKAVHPMAAQDA
jgi:hypothetical protein